MMSLEYELLSKSRQQAFLDEAVADRLASQAARPWKTLSQVAIPLPVMNLRLTWSLQRPAAMAGA